MDILSLALQKSGVLLDGADLAIGKVARKQTADAVHDVRVAIRRLDQCVEVFSNQFKGGAVKALRQQLRVVLHAAAEVRERDVVAGLCLKAGVACPRSLAADRRTAAKELARIARGWSKVQLEPRKRVRAFDPDLLRQCAARFFKAGRKAQRHKEGSTALHDFRLVAKGFRYTLELFAGSGYRDVDGKLKILRRSLHLLGEISDCQSAARLLRDSAPMAKFLVKRERHCVAQFREHWQKFAGKPGEKRRWLRDLSGNA